MTSDELLTWEKKRQDAIRRSATLTREIRSKQKDLAECQGFVDYVDNLLIRSAYIERSAYKEDLEGL